MATRAQRGRGPQTQRRALAGTRRDRRHRGSWPGVFIFAGKG